MRAFTYRTDVSRLSRWLEVPKSVYYYKVKTGKPGAKPSTYTLKSDGTVVENNQVVEDIRRILSEPFVLYGYENVSVELKEVYHYIINKKKVYRLMDEQKLLLGKVIRTSGRRMFVQQRKINASKPMEHLCLDIKYVWVHGEKRFYYLLSIMDVYSRRILAWLLQKSIRKMDVINLFRTLNQQYNIKDVYVRNDNGSQFIANDVKRYLQSVEAKQEFTHIATPEENSYIEAFHSILQREVIDRFIFESGYEAKITLVQYFQFYNEKRRHRKIGFISPMQKWNESVNLNENDLNHFRKSVQLIGG
jgi:putative transposase